MSRLLSSPTVSWKTLGDFFWTPQEPLLENARQVEQKLSSSHPAFSVWNVFMDWLAKTPFEKQQERFLADFDVMPAAPPYAGWYLFGEDVSRRSALMAQLKKVYIEHGLDEEKELPDHFGLLLAFADYCSKKERKELFRWILEPALAQMQKRLEAVQSPYAPMVEAVFQMIQKEE